MRYGKYNLVLIFLCSGIIFADQVQIDEFDCVPSDRGILSNVSSQLLGQLLQKFSHDPYHNKVASIRALSDGSVCQEENDAVIKRTQACKESLKGFLGKTLDGKFMPRIALCCSGGGVRALLASAGFMKGMDDNGMLDLVTYISALSGSTWTLAPWMQSGLNFSQFYPILIQRVINGMLHKLPKDIAKELASSFPVLAEYFIRKILYKETPSLIDFYGYCLALNFSNTTLLEHYATTNITGQQKSIVNGEFPFPLYSAIIPKKNNAGYAWMTFSPYEVASYDLGSAVPAWAYGRTFVNGVSVNSAPPLSLGFLMGLWGSACSVSFKEAYDMVLATLEPKVLFESLKIIADDAVIGDTRIFPAYLANYTYGVHELPLSEEKENIAIDAGIRCNIPVPPLLSDDRVVDIIIIVDASSDILGAPELKIAQEYAQAHRLPFPAIDYSSLNNQPYSIFDDGADSLAPIVIYVPMIKNNNYSSTFDPQYHLGITGFMNTFNFKYSKEEADLVAGLFTQAAYELRKDLLKIINQVLDRKNSYL